MENKKTYPKDIGAIWIKESSYGEYLSILVEIEGVKHNFTAFPNRFKEAGDKKPAYTIPAPKDKVAKASTDKYETQLDTIMKAREAAMSASKANAGSSKASYQMDPTITEDDLPF